MPAQVLQLCPLLAELEHALAERFTVHRWFEIPDPEAMLAAHGPAIRAVVTGGHLGIPDALAARLPALEIVAINGVGFDKVDLEAARARGFRVTNTPDVLTDDVADLAIGLAIALLRRIPQADRHVRAGRWPEAEVPLARKVSAQRFGILGLGRIGKAIARRLEGFGVPIAYTDLAPQDVPYSFHPTPTALAHAVDVLIVAAAAGTRPLIDQAVLDALGPEGVLVNVARGALVDEPALVAALQEGRLGGAALDVFAAEPHVPESLRSLPNLVLTPHIASATIDTRRAMAELVLANLDAHFAGQPLPTAVV
jgi:lactate dehydrogenase-like 2-hydroxyacid dehydrogenase